MNILLARNLFTKYWMIDPMYVETMLPMVASMIEHKAELPQDKIVESKVIGYVGPRSTLISAIRSNQDLENAPKGSIAVINVAGPLMKNDQFCGPAGMATIGAWIEQADRNPNIDGIILSVDSPGGTVDGLEDLGNKIKATKKPIAAFVDGTMASAAYWIGSSCDTIIANGKTAHIGSIGVMTSFADIQPALEKAGVKFHEVYSSLSADKNKEFRDARSGDYTGLINGVLDPLATMFSDTVKKNRAGKLSTKENVLTGKMYFATDAKKHGLVDSIGTMDDAVSYIRNHSSNKKNKMSEKKQRAHLNKALGWPDGAESTDEGTYLQDSELDTIEASLEELSSSQAELSTLRTGAITAAATTSEADATIAAQAAKILTLEARIEQMGKAPATSGNQPAGPANETTDPPQSAYVDDGSEAVLKAHGIK